MLRYETPYCGKRFLLNTNTGEIHDLSKETPSCHIDEIKPEHIWMDIRYENAAIRASHFNKKVNPNGCRYCLPDKNTD